MNQKTQSNPTNSNPVASGASVQNMDRAAENAHPTIDRAVAGAHKAVDNADVMASHAAEAIDRAGVKGKEMFTASTNYMREHPLLTVALAVTAGYALSRLLSSR